MDQHTELVLSARCHLPSAKGHHFVMCPLSRSSCLLCLTKGIDGELLSLRFHQILAVPLSLVDTMGRFTTRRALASSDLCRVVAIAQQLSPFLASFADGDGNTLGKPGPFRGAGRERSGGRAELADGVLKFVSDKTGKPGVQRGEVVP